MTGEADGDALAPIVARLDRSPQAEAFARAVLRRVAPSRLDQAEPAATAAVLASAFDFVDGRKPGEIAIRVTDPPVTADGSRPLGSVVEVSCDDRPFVVSTLREEIRGLGRRVVDVLHPVYGAVRDAAGRLAEVVPARDAGLRESFVQLELTTPVDPEDRPAIEERLCQVLEDVFAVAADQAGMRREIEWVAEHTGRHGVTGYPAEEVAETVGFLGWLLDDNFVPLGTCRFDDPERSLGILSRPGAPLRTVPPEGGPGPLLRIRPTAEFSAIEGRQPVHRIDVVDAGGGPGFRMVGVFTRKASTEAATGTPLVRLKLRRILESEDLIEGSEEAKALTSLFQVLPKAVVFESDPPALREILNGLMAAEDQHGVQALLHVEPHSSTVSALVSMPSDRYSPSLRQRLERFLLAQLDGARVESHVTLGDRADAILRVVVHVEGPLPAQPLDPLVREIRMLCRTWDQELATALGERVGDQAGRRLARTFSDWFPPGYRDTVPAGEAVDDVLHLDRLAGDGDFSVVLAPDHTGRAHARFKVYSAGAAVELSRFLPILESLGLWVIEERVHALGSGSRRLHLHDFAVTDPQGTRLDLDADGPRLADAADALWHGRAEVDSLNRLVLRAAMPWDDVALLRAYHRFRNQVGSPFSTAYVSDVLAANAAATRSIVELFEARFDPRLDAAPDDVETIRRRVEEGYEAVTRLDHDRVLRGFAALVEATLRTNRYSGAGTHLALKFDSAAVPGIPRPVPYREIFVYGPTVEGVHLRWGPVARGGIRRTERPDDYRSEVLGLMRTQVLKNALIVPTGAKGGFLVKHARHSGATPVDVREAYEIFIRCLLEITDNVVGGRVVPVATRQDGDDPYLVVAADRGTAGLSDLANRVSEARRFWLGDAFASGGSHGYDHKRLGITARGAWVAVCHHFNELGIDLADEPTTVVGIGDMSGDVFGNFMQQSDRIKLVAAFDHRDIFVDPDPDPERSFKERSRLFDLPSSSWQDYDRSVLSPGGGVWSRFDKQVHLSPQARAALGVEDGYLAPPDLIRAILQAPVGLLFAGGIGTFVRGGDEPDGSVDDRVNSEVRVVGAAIRARVVGEGANLAFTQGARIEFARRGGRINTDAIDNSAGVDVSDREVNLKILLRPAVESGEVTNDERDRILADVCDDVVAAVLTDCARQSLAISRAQAAAPGLGEATEALMSQLEVAGVLDRTVEVLPSTEEMEARSEAGAGLTRPELAVLLAGAKRRLTAQLLASSVPDEPALREEVATYFPPPIIERFGHLVDAHRLRRELVASRMANDIVDRMGPTFVSRIESETGAGASAVAAAYWIARGVSGSRAYWDDIDCDNEARIEPAAAVCDLLESLVRTYLRRGECAGIAAVVGRDRPAYAILEPAMADLGTTQQQRRLLRRAEGLIDSGADEPSALRWAGLEALAFVPGIAELSRRSGRELVGVASTVLALSEALGIDRLLERLHADVPSERWSRAAWLGLVDDLDDLRRAAARLALAAYPDDDALVAARRFLADRAALVRDAAVLVKEIGSDPQAGLDAASVAARTIRRILD